MHMWAINAAAAAYYHCNYPIPLSGCTHAGLPKLTYLLDICVLPMLRPPHIAIIKMFVPKVVAAPTL